ncbi:1-acyl-sn-glycerol-3-phosphate acyltransferase [Streptococcus mitis]|uniref:1-acyl-sn-glycerol-3-phosphate acyltransferase n=1 Tax=Streptococcus mitis TaxID=28037 RepID=A0A139R557_STRMT|nr:1-acyl-sn-glycerol-3-phosphate acyltransferase [Streptococcus mitis]
MPVTYTGPMTLKGLISRERVDMNFGNPIDISDIKKMNDEGIDMVANRIQTEFQRLDEETKQWHNDKNQTHYGGLSASLPSSLPLSSLS